MISRCRQSLSIVCLVALSSPMSAQQLIWQVEAAKPEDQLLNASVGPDDDGDGIAELLLGYAGEVCDSASSGVVREFSTVSGQLEQWCGMSRDGYFGAPVRWMDDIDGGGEADFAVAEPFYNAPSVGYGVGRIQVYSGETGALIYEVVGTKNDGFFGGFSVCGDVDGDGLRDLLVGLPRYGPNYEGEVWVVAGADGALLRVHLGTNSDMALGWMTVGLGDVDGDGVDDYAFSAINWQVDVCSGSTGALIQRIKDATAGNFGLWIARCDDVDGDGLADILISHMESVGDGAVDAYSVSTGVRIWSVRGLSKVEYFGLRTLEVGDQNADGIRDFLFYASEDKHDGRSAGRVDLISGANRRALFRFYPNAKGARYYGQLLAPGADFNADGIEDLVIGMPDGGALSKDAGVVQIRAGNDLWLQADPIAPVDGDTVIVDLRGAPAGQLGLIALIAIDGTPVFETLLLAPFDTNGELQLCADVDASVSGMEFTVMGYAQNPKGRGPLVDASPFVVSVK